MKMENKGKGNGNHTKQNMDTDKNNHKFYIPLKKREQHTTGQDTERRQVVFPSLCSRLFYTGNK